MERLSRGEKLRKTEEDEPRGDSDESASFAVSPRTVNRWLFMRINETNLNVAALRLSLFLSPSLSPSLSVFLDNAAGGGTSKAALAFPEKLSALLDLEVA